MGEIAEGPTPEGSSNHPAQASTFHRVRAAALIGFSEVARLVGLEPLEQLARHKIHPEQLASPENWLPAQAVVRLLQCCALESGRSDFAILLAECRTFSSLGPLSLLLKHEASLRQIILQIGNFRRHLNDVFDVHLEQSNDVAIVRWTVEPGFATREVVALVSAMGYRALTEAMNGSWSPARVHFPFDQPSDLSAYRRYFACPVEFGSRFSGFSFPASDLDQLNPSADKDMAQHAASLLDLAPSPPESMIDGVKHAIMLLLPSGKGTLENVALNLGTQPRTLQRRLASHGQPFARLLNDTRRCLAIHYLSNPSCRISEVASLTGYSSVSAFSRWFEQQFGTSPARWRRTDGTSGLISDRMLDL